MMTTTAFLGKQNKSHFTGDKQGEALEGDRQ